MAATDTIKVRIEGRGGHAARPQTAIDPVLVGAHIVTALQSIVSRNIDPVEAAVISICTFHAGSADNVIPQYAELGGTARSLTPEVRELLLKRIAEVIEGTAALHGAKADLELRRGYPVLVNHARQTEFATTVAGAIAGPDRVEAMMPPVLGAEDFAYMLEARPGAFIFVGNGDSAGLHHPRYDFNDEVIAYGTSYWVKLVETALPA